MTIIDEEPFKSVQPSEETQSSQKPNLQDHRLVFVRKAGEKISPSIRVRVIRTTIITLELKVYLKEGSRVFFHQISGREQAVTYDCQI